MVKQLTSILSLVILLTVFTSNISAQDIHFTQFYNSPLSLNPATTGLFEGDWRVMGNYRSQWAKIGDPFSTFSAGYDQHFTVMEQDVNGGLYFVNDKSGMGGFLNVQKVFLSGGYHKELFGHDFYGGLQLGFVNKSINTQNATFPNQWDRDPTSDGGGRFNNSLSNNENSLSEGIGYFDANLGISWTHRFGSFVPTAGISLFHLTNPKEVFFETSEERLTMRTGMYAECRYEINKKVSLTPRVFTMATTKATDMLFGLNGEYKIIDSYTTDAAVYGGFLFRDGIKSKFDASAFVVGLKVNNLDVGFSYDMTISDLQTAANNVGGFEISVIYISNKIPKKIVIPCDRL